jgi:hypothetical protein
MSQEVDVVAKMLAVHDDKDVLPSIGKALEAFKGLRPHSRTDANVAAKALGKDRGWRLCSPEIVWDMSATGLGPAAHGAGELCQWWTTWVTAWSKYVYRVDEKNQQELGEWVLTKGDVVATARNGQSVELPVWQLWKVADGRVTVMRAFLTESDARAAAGVRAERPRRRVTRAGRRR